MASQDGNTLRVTEHLSVHRHPGDGADRPHLVIEALDTRHDDHPQELVVFLGETRCLADVLIEGAARLTEAEARRLVAAGETEEG